MSFSPLVGFISPPAWYDPSPTEFLSISAEPVRVQQYPLPLSRFDWRIDSVAQTEPDLILAAQTLGEVGCDLVAKVGTPFAWAGLASGNEARLRCDRLAKAARVPVVMAGIAILDAFDVLGAERIGLACTYYSDYWRDHWSRYVAASGFEVVTARTLTDQGLMPPHDDSDKAHWAPTPAQITASVRKLVDEAPGVQAVAISGAGSRTISVISTLEHELGRPVLGSDTALYWAAARVLDIKLKDAVLGMLTDA